MYCFRFLYYRARRAVVSRTHRWLWPHIHTPDDGRGRRVALVDGVEVPRAFYANTRAGFVRYHLEPVRANRRRTAARWAKRRGVVVVLPREETQDDL